MRLGFSVESGSDYDILFTYSFKNLILVNKASPVQRIKDLAAAS